MADSGKEVGIVMEYDVFVRNDETGDIVSVRMEWTSDPDVGLAYAANTRVFDEYGWHKCSTKLTWMIPVVT